MRLNWRRRWQYWLALALLVCPTMAMPGELEDEADEKINTAATKYCDFISAQSVLVKGSVERFQQILNEPSSEEVDPDTLELVGKSAFKIVSTPVARSSPTAELAVGAIDEIVGTWLETRQRNREAEGASDWASGTAVLHDVSRLVDDFASLCSTSGAEGSEPQLAYIMSRHVRKLDKPTADRFLESLQSLDGDITPGYLPSAREMDVILLETYINGHRKFKGQGYIAFDVNERVSGQWEIESITVKTPLGARVKVFLSELLKDNDRFNVFNDLRVRKVLRISTMGGYGGTALVSDDGARVLDYKGSVQADPIVNYTFDKIKELALPED